jgi:hypothetical protein
MHLEIAVGELWPYMENLFPSGTAKRRRVAGVTEALNQRRMNMSPHQAIVELFQERTNRGSQFMQQSENHAIWYYQLWEILRQMNHRQLTQEWNYWSMYRRQPGLPWELQLWADNILSEITPFVEYASPD